MAHGSGLIPNETHFPCWTLVACPGGDRAVVRPHWTVGPCVGGSGACHPAGRGRHQEPGVSQGTVCCDPSPFLWSVERSSEGVCRWRRATSPHAVLAPSALTTAHHVPALCHWLSCPVPSWRSPAPSAVCSPLLSARGKCQTRGRGHWQSYAAGMGLAPDLPSAVCQASHIRALLSHALNAAGSYSVLVTGASITGWCVSQSQSVKRSGSPARRWWHVCLAPLTLSRSFSARRPHVSAGDHPQSLLGPAIFCHQLLAAEGRKDHSHSDCVAAFEGLCPAWPAAAPRWLWRPRPSARPSPGSGICDGLVLVVVRAPSSSVSAACLCPMDCQLDSLVPEAGLCAFLGVYEQHG